jgi:hypothetical protein
VNAAGKLCFQLAEPCGKHVSAPDNDIIIARRHVICGMKANGFLESPPYAVAYHRIAGFASHGEADTRLPVVAAVQNFEQEKPAAPLLAALHGQKFCAFQKPARLLPGRLAGFGQRFVSVRR